MYGELCRERQGPSHSLGRRPANAPLPRATAGPTRVLGLARLKSKFVRDAAKLPPGLPLELQQEDRRKLDDAVFELFGVQNPRRRKDLIDRLYREVASHFRSIRIVEVQKMEQRRHGGGKDDVSQTELAVDAWNHADGEFQEPLPTWVEDENG